jgi:hypothetical protein
MTMFAGLDVGGELWTPIQRRLQRHCRVRAVALACSEACRNGVFGSLHGRAAGDGCGKSRRVKSDKADAYALAEMLRTGWYSSVHVKSENTHRLKALLGARDQLVRAKRRSATKCAGCYGRLASGCRRARHEEVRRGGTSGSATRRVALCERDGADGRTGDNRGPDRSTG